MLVVVLCSARLDGYGSCRVSLVPGFIIIIILWWCLAPVTSDDSEDLLSSRLRTDAVDRGSDTSAADREWLPPDSESDDDNVLEDSGVSSTENDEVFRSNMPNQHSKIRRRLTSYWLKNSPSWLQTMDSKNSASEVLKTPLTRKPALPMSPALISRFLWPNPTINQSINKYCQTVVEAHTVIVEIVRFNFVNLMFRIQLQMVIRREMCSSPQRSALILGLWRLSIRDHDRI